MRKDFVTLHYFPVVASYLLQRTALLPNPAPHVFVLHNTHVRMSTHRDRHGKPSCPRPRKCPAGSCCRVVKSRAGLRPPSPPPPVDTERRDALDKDRASMSARLPVMIIIGCLRERWYTGAMTLLSSAIFCACPKVALRPLFKEMFTSKAKLEQKTGKWGIGRFKYLQALVTEFQDTSRHEYKLQVLANLANFAYDPVNYDYFRQLNILDLFLGTSKLGDVIL